MQTTPSCIWAYYLMTHLWPSSVKACLRASGSRLNPSKTQVVCLGTGQQLAKVDTDELSLLASRVYVLDVARNLGVIFDSQLSMSAQVSAACRTGYYQLRQLHPLVWCLSEDAGLLQLAVLRHSRYFDEPPVVSSERRRTSHHRSQSVRAHHASPMWAALAASLQTSGFQHTYPIVRWPSPHLCT